MVDGHHRLRAAKEAGLTQAPALVVKAESLDAAVAMLSLNRLRGELDLTKVADILQGLSAGGFEDLTLTGFNGGEIQALLETSDRGTDGISGLGEDAGADVGPVEVETIAATRHAVRIIFDKAEDLALVRSVALRYGTTIEAGLLTLCKSQQE